MRPFCITFNILFVFQLCFGVRINFTNCQSTDWTCAETSDITYTCSNLRNNNFVIHLKDFYTESIRSVTVQRCKDLTVILDCPLLQRPSQLQRFNIKDCDRVDFVSLNRDSLTQTPPEVVIENVNEVVQLPRGMFKSPNTPTEVKCLGGNSLKTIQIINSKINSLNTRAIHNVSRINNIEFRNVTVIDTQSRAIEALMSTDNSVFKIINSNLLNLAHKAITVVGETVTFSDNLFNDITTNSINITSVNLLFNGNRINTVKSNGLKLQSANIEFLNNHISLLKTNSLASVKCSRKTSRNQFKFINNKIENVEPYSLLFDYGSCKVSNTPIEYRDNRIDCECRNIAFLNSETPSTIDLFNTIMNPTNNNTCLLAPCLLPVETVKFLIESNMCSLSLDPQVICLLYHDRQSTVQATTDEEITEAEPTFYLIKQANSPNSDASDMRVLNKEELLNDSRLNMSNRTTIKVVFDSSMDFVETLRSVNNSRKRPKVVSTTPRAEVANRCVGTRCRDKVAHDRQKALDFYKYVYAQLRPPKQNDKKKKT